MWDLPGPGLEPVSPALAGRFLITVPPGKSLIIHFKWVNSCYVNYISVKLFQKRGAVALKSSSQPSSGSPAEGTEVVAQAWMLPGPGKRSRKNHGPGSELSGRLWRVYSLSNRRPQSRRCPRMAKQGWARGRGGGFQGRGCSATWAWPGPGGVASFPGCALQQGPLRHCLEKAGGQIWLALQRVTTDLTEITQQQSVCLFIVKYFTCKIPN